METDDRIRTLAADASREPAVERRLFPALATGGLVTLTGFLYFIGPRSDLLATDQYLDVILKLALGLAVGFGGLGTALAAARPGAEVGAWKWLLLAAPAFAILAFFAELALLPPPLWKPAFLGNSIGTWLTGISLTGISLPSLPLVAASIADLSQGASIKPRRTEALTELKSGCRAGAV